MTKILKIRALLLTLAVVRARPDREQDVSCVSFFQQDLHLHSLAVPQDSVVKITAPEDFKVFSRDVFEEAKLLLSPDALANITKILNRAKAHASADYAITIGSDPTPADVWMEGNNTSGERMGYMWQHDVFPGAERSHITTGDEGLNFFKSAPLLDWIVLLVLCVALVLFDAFVLRLCPSTLAWHLGIIGFWIVIAVFYNIFVWQRGGPQLAIEWASGYILEWMLSVDNLFVFHLVLQSYKTPEAQVHKAVMIGIIGAVGMRLVFFMVVSTLLRAFTWFRYPFGALLIWSGIEAARSEDDDDDDLEDTRMVRMLRWVMGSRLSSGYDEKGHGVFTWDADGRLQCTMLFVVIFVLEASDLLFALDSVSAKVAQIPQQYVAFTSSVLAMFGLRAMFFVVRDLVEIFDLLKYGICLILVFIGVELMLSRVLQLSSLTVCIIIVSVFVFSILASYMKQMKGKKEEEDDCSSEKKAKNYSDDISNLENAVVA